MSEFKKKEPYRKVTVRMDEKMINMAKEKGVNVSAVCRYALKLALAGKLYRKEPVARAE